MNNSENILFRLLRAALGNETEVSLPDDVDWNAVVDLAFDQGVAAMMVDGLQKSGTNALLESEELEDLRYELFGEALSCEEDYRKQKETLEKLREEIPEGLVVLKGLSIARNYPEPSHRGCVDLDVFINKNDNNDSFLQNVQVIREDYKHTGFMYQGVMVEYHKSLIGWKSLKKGKYIEKTLRESLGTPGSIYPNDYFNALFLTVHSYTHFMIEDGISLKHIIDWFLLCKEFRGESLELRERASKTLESFGMREFAESMTRVADYVCKDPSTALAKTDSRMLDDILALGKKKRFKNGHLNMTYNILFRNGWKFKAFAKESNLTCLIRCGWNAIINKQTDFIC